MTREIKFKMWHKKSKKMYKVEKLDIRDKFVYMWNYLNYSLSYFSLDEVELMQCVGLKDRNGTDIYEGDILDYDGELWEVQYSIDDGMFVLYYDHVTENFSNMNSKWFDVIGNIYEDSDLLEVGEENE